MNTIPTRLCDPVSENPAFAAEDLILLKLLKIIRMTALALIAAAACGCTEIEEASPPEVTETSFVEKPYPVTAGSLIFDGSPATVGSLSPALTEIICELGYEDKLIGVSDYCDYPEEVTGKAKLGSAANPDVDAVIEAAPELLVSLSPIAKKDITAIEASGTRVWIISPPESASELYECYEDVASVFGGKLESEQAADEALKPFISALKGAEGAMDSFVYIMSPELAAASDSTFAGSFFSCFGKNAAGEEEDDILTSEKLLELDPQWIILPETISIYELPEETAGLTAIKENRVIYLDSEILERIERPTSRLEETVRDILEQIRGE